MRHASFRLSAGGENITNDLTINHNRRNHNAMKNFENTEIDMDRMKSKYAHNPQFRTLIDFLAQQEKDDKCITVDDLERRMDQADIAVRRTDVIRMLQALHGWDCGWFIIGRRQHVSRFWFNVSSTQLGKEVSGKGMPASPPNPPIAMLTHKFRLRPELEISLDLPSDLSKKEIGRIADFLQTLPFDHAGLRIAA
jgi:hypothetical protein